MYRGVSALKLFDRLSFGNQNHSQIDALRFNGDKLINCLKVISLSFLIFLPVISCNVKYITVVFAVEMNWLNMFESIWFAFSVQSRNFEISPKFVVAKI